MIVCYCFISDSGIQTVRAYKPPTDVEDKIQTIAKELFGGSQDLLSVSLEDRTEKFKVKQAVRLYCEAAIIY